MNTTFKIMLSKSIDHYTILKISSIISYICQKIMVYEKNVLGGSMSKTW